MIQNGTLQFEGVFQTTRTISNSSTPKMINERQYSGELYPFFKCSQKCNSENCNQAQSVPFRTQEPTLLGQIKELIQ